jgi:cell wall-associated NlpC family hydrolase
MHALARTALTTALTLGAAGLALVAGPVAAHASTTPSLTAHDSVGALTSAKAVTGGVLLTGWASDPDALTPAHATSDIRVVVREDGSAIVGSGDTNLADAAVTKKHHTGPTPDYSVTVPLPTGTHTLCVVAANVGPGASAVLGCTTTPLGRTLTATQVAAHKPQGALTAVSASASSLRVTGWTTDPDWIGRRITTVLYVDGSSAGTVLTTTYAGTRPKGAGPVSAFDITVPVATGTHVACVWAVNVALGNGNSLLGCSAADTRGKAGSGALPSPAVNKAVVKEAIKHKGQKYIWAAEGPKTFDCSGLVQYSYAKAGVSLPRVSSAQAEAARLIPASRAVPGDLVFFHDNEGDVYHVAIYIKPGQAFAAIDTAEGVNYQTIWDPTEVTYGSFTHT